MEERQRLERGAGGLGDTNIHHCYTFIAKKQDKSD